MYEGQRIGALCLRYVVPFYYDMAFKDACEAVEKQEDERNRAGKKRKKWHSQLEDCQGTESDLYDYVRNEFRFAHTAGLPSNGKKGCEWLFWNSKTASESGDGKVKELFYFDGDIAEDKRLEVTVTNLGLYLFRNGCGFLWYELEPKHKDKLTAEELIRFQYRVKELNRADSLYLWEKCSDVPRCGMPYDERNLEHIKYMSPFCFGEWVNQLLDFLSVSYTAERKSAYQSMMEKVRSFMKEQEEKQEWQMSAPVYLEDEKYQYHEKAPDKALLFSYCVLENAEGMEALERKRLVYYLTNGYKESYHYSASNAEHMARPFADALWYATQEGALYMAYPGADNRETFCNLIRGKVAADYFTLYIKCLYQSYSLLLYAKRIQAEIPAVSIDKFSAENSAAVTDLCSELNLFLTKSMATTVSHINHQSEFYIYLEARLHIREDAKSVTAGLDALDSLQRELREKAEDRSEQERDKRMQAGIGLISILAVFSALLDGFDYVAKFMLRDGDVTWFGLCQEHPVVFLAEICVVLVIVCFGAIFGYYIIKGFRESKQR